MDNNLYITNKTKAIEELLISYIVTIVKEKKAYEVFRNQYSKYANKLSSINRELKFIERYYGNDLSPIYNHLYYSRIYSNSYGYKRYALIREKMYISTTSVPIKKKCDLAYKNYIDAQNNLYNYLNNLTEIDLRGVIEYFDINIGVNFDDANIKEIMIDKLKNAMLEDFEILLQHHIELPNVTMYRGKIYFIEILINQKNNYEIKMKEYNDEKEKSNKLQLLLNKENELLKTQSSKIEEIENSFFDKLFKHSKLGPLKEELERTNGEIRSLITNLCIINDNLITLNQDAITVYRRYTDLYNSFNRFIDELSESSLKKLMNLLNIKINIVKTNDKYFNVKNEMRKELRKYLYVEEIEPLIQNQNSKEDMLNKQLIKRI